jgi:hypothetical protein
MSQSGTAAPRAATTTGAAARRLVSSGRRYLVRHWRGDVALPTASLLLGLLVGAALVALAVVFGGPIVDRVEPTVAALGLTGVWAVIAALTLWQVVGIVRAADRHARAGRGLAAGAWVVAALLGAVVASGLFLRAGLPQIVEASQFALGKDPIGDVALRVSDDGTTLEVDGPIVFGVAARVRDLLAAYPAIETVRLASPGGRVIEARDLRDEFRARRLTTVAVGNCASACIVAFMGGRDRLLAPGSNLGFHRYRSPGLGEPEAEASMAIDRRDFGAHGVPAWFLERAFTTPNSEMWRPTTAELRAARIFTGQLGADGRRVEPPRDRAAIDRELSGLAPYAALRTHEPALYAGIVDAIEAGTRRGAALDELAAREWPQAQRAAAKYATYAADDAVVEAAGAAASTMRALQTQSAEACYRYVRAAAEPDDLTAIPFELRQRALKATAALITTGAPVSAAAPAPLPLGDGATAVDRLREDLGDDASTLERLAAADVDRAAVCGAVAALYERALTLPPPRRTEVLRLLLARI